MLLGSLTRLGVIAAEQLAWPSDIASETPGLCTLRVLAEGRNPYGPETYADVPFVLTMYTPLYFLVVSALPSIAGAPFLMGRCVALLAMLGAAALLLAVPGRRPRALDALALGWFFLLWAPAVHAAYLRNDSLALLCAAASITLLARSASPPTADGRPAGRRTGPLIASALLALLAIAAKQSYVAAAVAGLVFLLLADRRAARVYAAALAAGALAGVLLIETLWGRGFWFCTLDAPRNPYDLATFAWAWASELKQPAFDLLLLAALLLALQALRRTGRTGSAGRTGRTALRESPYLLYALAALAVLLATVGKTGASDIYFLETELALLLWMLHALSRRERGDAVDARDARGARGAREPRDSRPGARIVLVATLAFVVAGHELLRLPLPPWLRAGDVSEARRLDESVHRAAASARLEQLGLSDPLLLNLASPRDAGLFGERICVNDPFLYDLLWRQGKLDVGAVEAAIARSAFDLVLLSPRVAWPPAASPEPGPRLARALEHSYRLIGRDAAGLYFVRP